MAAGENGRDGGRRIAAPQSSGASSRSSARSVRSLGSSPRSPGPSPRSPGPSPRSLGSSPRSPGPSPRSSGPPPRAPRTRTGELISFAGALVLLVLMFAFKWFGLAVTASPSAQHAAASGAEDAWNGLTVLRWLMLVTIVTSVGAVVLHAKQRSHGSKTDTSLPVTALGALTAVLLAYRVLIDLPSPDRVVDQKLGAYLGLLAAVAIAYGGYESIREQRARVRAAVYRHHRSDARTPSRVEAR